MGRGTRRRSGDQGEAGDFGRRVNQDRGELGTLDQYPGGGGVRDALAGGDVRSGVAVLLVMLRAVSGVVGRGGAAPGKGRHRHPEAEGSRDHQGKESPHGLYIGRARRRAQAEPRPGGCYSAGGTST